MTSDPKSLDSQATEIEASGSFDAPTSARLEAHLARKKRQTTAQYASTGRRGWAYTIDQMIIAVINTILGGAFNMVHPPPPFEMMPPELQIGYDASGMPVTNIAELPTTDQAMQMIFTHWISQLGHNMGPLFLLPVLINMVYYSYFIASSRQATPGMRFLKIVVTDRRGNPISLWHAAGRTAASFLTYLTLGIGFLTAMANKRRLALHDWVSGTEIRMYDPEFEAERQRRTEEARQQSLLEAAKRKETAMATRASAGSAAKATVKPVQLKPAKTATTAKASRPKASQPKAATTSGKPARPRRARPASDKPSSS